MHGLQEHLLHLGQIDVGLVASFAFHLCGDTTDDNDGVGSTHFLGEVGEVDEDSFADITAQQGELAVVVTVFDDDVVGLASLDGERLVFHLAAETEPAAHASLGLFDHLAVDAEGIAVVGRQRVFHLAREGGLVLAADADGKGIATHAVGKAPGAEGGEVELVVIVGLHGRAFHRGVIPEFHLGTPALVEVGQMVDGGVLIVQFAGLVIDDVGIGDSSLDAC